MFFNIKTEDISNNIKEEISDPFEDEYFKNRENEEFSYYNPQNDENLYTNNDIGKNVEKSNNSTSDFNFVYYIFDSNHLIFNIGIIRDEFSIEYDNNLNEYKKLIKIKEIYEEKYKNIEYATEESILLDNLKKLLNFIEKIKEKLKDEFMNEFELKINLVMKVNKENEKQLNKNIKNIDCRYQIDNSDNDKEELFEDKNILINDGPGKDFENFVDKIKNKFKINLSTINECEDKINKSGLNDLINIKENINIPFDNKYSNSNLFSDHSHPSIINQFSGYSDFIKNQDMKSNSKDQINKALVSINLNKSSNLSLKQENKIQIKKDNLNINTSHFLKEFTDINFSDIR